MNATVLNPEWPEHPPQYLDAFAHSRYSMWRTTLAEWRVLRLMMEPMPAWLAPEESWIHDCMDTQDQMANLHGALRWKMMVIGERNSSMFFHSDDFATATLQVQMVGKKRWIVCKGGVGERHKMSNLINTFEPDFKKFPKFAEAECYDTIALPGDVLYYPTHFWHHTINLSKPSVGFTARRVDESNWEKVFDQLSNKCANPGVDTTKDFPGSAPNLNAEVCKNLAKCRAKWARADWDLYGPTKRRYVQYDRRLHRLGMANIGVDLDAV